MTTGEALLQAVLDEPGDDVRRLVYADWLEEYGQDWVSAIWAKLIRFHMKQPPYLEAKEILVEVIADPPRSERLIRWGITPFGWRSDETAHLKQLITGLLRDSPSITGLWTFRRGFVDEVDLTCDQFMEHAAALFSQHPITRVGLTDRKPLPRAYHGFPRNLFLLDKYLYAKGDLIHSLPNELWPAHVRLCDEQTGKKRFWTAEEAMAGLSTVCVAHGRQQAGKAREIGAHDST